MGGLSRIVGPDVYVDANVLISHVENFAAYAAVLGPLFDEFERGAKRAVTSEITLAEVLVKPIRTNDAAAVTAYTEAFQPPSVLMAVPVSREVLLEAAAVRARTTLKLPDTIHVATASLRRCNTVLTNDKGMSRYPGLNVVLLSDLVGTP